MDHKDIKKHTNGSMMKEDHDRTRAAMEVSLNVFKEEEKYKKNEFNPFEDDSRETKSDHKITKIDLDSKPRVVQKPIEHPESDTSEDSEPKHKPKTQLKHIEDSGDYEEDELPIKKKEVKRDTKKVSSSEDSSMKNIKSIKKQTTVEKDIQKTTTKKSPKKISEEEENRKPPPKKTKQSNPSSNKLKVNLKDLHKDENTDLKSPKKTTKAGAKTERSRRTDDEPTKAKKATRTKTRQSDDEDNNKSPRSMKNSEKKKVTKNSIPKSTAKSKQNDHENKKSNSAKNIRNRSRSSEDERRGGSATSNRGRGGSVSTKTINKMKTTKEEKNAKNTPKKTK
jgi:hypothetical protein